MKASHSEFCRLVPVKIGSLRGEDDEFPHAQLACTCSCHVAPGEERIC